MTLDEFQGEFPDLNDKMDGDAADLEVFIEVDNKEYEAANIEINWTDNKVIIHTKETN